MRINNYKKCKSDKEDGYIWLKKKKKIRKKKKI